MAVHVHNLPYNIQNLTRIIASLSIIVLVSFISSGHGRILSISSSDDLISDGIDHSPALTANGSLVSTSTCQHTYGFLPCAENAPGYIFQIVVYQGLLTYGEIELGIGSKVFFKIIEKNFGTSKYVSIVFRFLMGLPSMIMMIVSGVSGSKENARSMVSLGVGIYAGITVFTLTLQWGICLIYGSKKLQDKSKSEHSKSQASCCMQARKKFNELKDTGVTLQRETRNVAWIMLLSLIPYIIVQLVDIFKASHNVLLLAFIVSTSFFIFYFIYQTVDPWMQMLTSEYMQYEILKNAFLQHVKRRGKLVDDVGSTNVALIKIVFDETDKDGDGSITESEMEKLFNKIMPEMSDDEVKSFVSQSFEKFDSDRDKKISLSEFNHACVELAENPNCISRGLSDKEFQQFSMMEINKLDINLIMSKILKHAQGKLLTTPKSLIDKDGNPDDDGINSLFRLIATDNNDWISRNELEEKISKVQFGNLNPKAEDVVNKLFFNFKKDDKNVIEKIEFVKAIEKWIKIAIRVAKCSDKTKSVEEFDKIVWKHFVYGLPFSFWEFLLCVGRMVLGIVILMSLGGPLTANILQLSYAMNVPSFSISFVIVPLAMNMRTLIEAIFPVSKKNEKTASLTFSEIYSSVAMNNISNLTILLAVVYAKDLPWDYSAEVLTILVVCAVIGILGCSRRTYPFWACVLAIALYPFSLALYCFVELVLHRN